MPQSVESTLVSCLLPHSVGLSPLMCNNQPDSMTPACLMCVSMQGVPALLWPKQYATAAGVMIRELYGV